MKELFSFFESFLPLMTEEKEAIEKRFSHRIVKRRQFILSPGEVCRHYSFVVEGCFKMYKVDESAKEHNILFVSENDWILDIGSFYDEKPSNLYIEALESSKILQITRDDLIYFFEDNVKFNRIFRVIIENKYIELQNRLLQTISTTAEERYLAFLDQYPNLTQRISNTQIASYIGITPEFLSRIRSQMAHQG